MKSTIKKILKEEFTPLNEQYYHDKEMVKNELMETIISEIISTLDYANRFGFDDKLTYNDISEVLEGVFANTEYLFMKD